MESRNYVLEHYLSRASKMESWEEIDEQSGMKVSAFTYITLFLSYHLIKTITPQRNIPC